MCRPLQTHRSQGLVGLHQQSVVPIRGLHQRSGRALQPRDLAPLAAPRQRSGTMRWGRMELGNQIGHGRKPFWGRWRVIQKKNQKMLDYTCWMEDHHVANVVSCCFHSPRCPWGPVGGGCRQRSTTCPVLKHAFHIYGWTIRTSKAHRGCEGRKRGLLVSSSACFNT